MKDIISFETAKALKEAGFPQPEFETGQFWYNDLGALTFVGRNEVNERFGKDYFYCTSVETGRTDFFQPVAHSAFFAPTATDILRELRDGSIIGVMNKRFICHSSDFLFPVDSEKTPIHDNPAEAAAQAFLKEKSNLNDAL